MDSSPLLVSRQYDNNFCIWYMNHDYKAFYRDKTAVFRDLELYDRIIASSSSPDRILLESDLTRIALETGSTASESNSFAHATMELVQNSSMHNYNTSRGVIHIHARFTDLYNLSSVVSDGRTASFEDVKNAFESSLSFYKTLGLVRENKIPKEELHRLLDGRRGKGIKEAIAQSDYFGFNLEDRRHYQMIISLKGTRHSPQKFINV